jgi:hypothetical protein
MESCCADVMSICFFGIARLKEKVVAFQEQWNLDDSQVEN